MSIGNNNKDIQGGVQEVFRQTFEQSDLVVSGSTNHSDIPKWDSLAHISLMMALEDQFNIVFSSEEITSISDVGQLISIIEGKS